VTLAVRVACKVFSVFSRLLAVNPSGATPSRRRLPAALGLILAVISGCDGCQERSGQRALRPLDASSENRQEATTPVSGEGVPQFIERRTSRQMGRLDFGNRYAFTVIVTSESKEEGLGQCSGVIIDRRLVLTAGHCVCRRRRTSLPEGGGGYVIDGAACSNSATVETMIYKPVEGVKDEAAALRTVYQGRVKTHPDFKVLLDDQGQIVSSHADLALIELKGATQKELRAVPLADQQVQVKQSMLIVGYGYDELASVYDTYRRSSVNEITEFPLRDGERGRFEQEGKGLYKGDSGGPCLQAGAGEDMLVGISSRNLGEGSTFTSTYNYREWLRREIERVQGAQPPGHSE
jgi:hypothetical protein